MIQAFARVAMIAAALSITSLARAQANDLTATAGPSPGLLEEFRGALGVPALSAATITDDDISVAAVGIRRLGWPGRVTRADRFHTGSDAKAMFATVAARLVEEGRVRWDTTIEEVFPAIVVSGGAPYKSVTLADLLRHRSGLMALDSVDDLALVPVFRGSPSAQRRQFADWVLRTQPVAEPGAKSEYSNAGYVVAAAMIESLTHQSYEDLMQRKLFGPLKLDASYEWPAWRAVLSQPWGHESVNGTLLPRSPHLPETQIPAWLRPASGVSVSTRDFARFVKLHLRGLRGQCALISCASFQALHTAVDGYALGWAVAYIDGRNISYHTGASGLFAASMFVDPGVGRAAVAMTNADSDIMRLGIQQIAAYFATAEQ